MKLYLNCTDNTFTFNKRDFLIRAAQRLGIDWVMRYETTQAVQPEYVLNIEPYEFIQGSKWTGVWAIDVLLNQDVIDRYWADCDAIFLAVTSNKYQQNSKTHLLLQACEPELHKPMDADKIADYVFVGSKGTGIYKERERCFAHLIANGITVEEKGNHFPPDDYVYSLNQGRVQFIRSMQVQGEGEIAQRFFECLGIGPVLTNWTPDLIHTGLIEGQDFLAYRDDEQMIQLFKMLLNDDDLSKKIAYNGRRKAMMYHTFEHRLATILHHIGEHVRKTG